MTEDQQRKSEDLLAKARQAKDEIRQADGAIKALREAQAEDAEVDRKAREFHPSGAPAPAGEHMVEPGKRADSLHGAPVASDGHVWRYADTGKLAAVGRGESFRSHE